VVRYQPPSDIWSLASYLGISHRPITFGRAGLQDLSNRTQYGPSLEQGDLSRFLVEKETPMKQVSARVILAIAASGALLSGCATTIDMGPGYYRYDSRVAHGAPAAVAQPTIQAPTVVEPAVVYQEPAIVYREPTVVYREPTMVYRKPAAIYYREPAVIYPEPLDNHYFHDHGQ
jgi:hypothetical protein